MVFYEIKIFEEANNKDSILGNSISSSYINCKVVLVGESGKYTSYIQFK